MNQKDFYTRQISFTEWFEKINHPDTVAIRIEDNEKRERLRILNEVTGLAFDKPFQFEAKELMAESASFKKFLEDHPKELWALRLIPRDPELPKLRMRGFTATELLKWFHEQSIDPKNYRVDFVPHPGGHLWASIFIVNANGMYGEIIKGGHQQLTQGFHDEGVPITFSFEFGDKTWRFSEHNADAEAECKKALEALRVSDDQKRSILKEKLEAEFAGNYLCGYFETVTSIDYGLWFIDYNRILGRLYKDFSVTPQENDQKSKTILKGQVGNPGKARGKAEIVLAQDLQGARIQEGEILVCNMTTPEYIHLMQSAGAIVTDLGGILSHAAIVARELKKPCVVGTGNATSVIKNKDEVEVNATEGIVTIL